MKAGITIDDWKLYIFERRLTEAGFTYVNNGTLVKGCLLLTVETKDLAALREVVQAANDEAARTGGR